VDAGQRQDAADIKATAARIDALLADAASRMSLSSRRSDLAVPLCREAVRLARRAGDRARRARATLQLGTALGRADSFREAEAVLQEAVRLAGELNEPTLEHNAVRGLGAVYLNQGRYDAAVPVMERALALAQRLNDPSMVARSLNNLSVGSLGQGNLADAVRYGKEATGEVDRALASGHPMTGQILFGAPFNYAKALSSAGDYLAAAPLFDRAFLAAAGNNDPGAQHHVLFDTAEWYEAQGDPDRAERYYTRALEQSRLIVESREAEAKSLCGLGSVAATRKQYGAAIELYGRCIALFDAAGRRGDLPRALAALARSQSLAGEHQAAAGSVQRALLLARETHLPIGVLFATLELARERLGLGALADAERVYSEAVALARAHAVLPLEPAALVGLGHVALAAGDRTGAVSAFRASEVAIERIRGRIISIDQRAAFAEASHETFLSLAAVLSDLHQDHPAAGHDREAFEVVEQERTRNLAAALADAGAGVLAPDLAGRGRAIERRLTETQIRLSSSDTPEAGRQALIAALDDGERELEALEAGRSRAAGTPAARVDRGGLVTLQRVLTDDEAFIEYVIGPNPALAFVVRRHQFTLVRLTLPERFLERAGVFARLLAGADGRDAEASGRVIAEAVLRPVLEAAGPGARRLIFAVSGEMAALPVAALPDPVRRDTAVPLVWRFDVSYVPSLSALGLLRDGPHEHAARDLVAVADPRRAPPSASAGAAVTSSLSDSLGALPYSIDEIRSIVPMAHRLPELLTGEAASETRLKALPLDQFKVLHFAAHTILDAQVPTRSAIVLATPDPGGEDGLLQAREVYGLRLTADLVVLSACRTAAGRESSAEGLDSLARAFLYAGARSVLATSWDVEDRAAAELVKHVYERLAAGDGIAAALAAAQRAAGGRAPYAQAARWAPFVVVGDPLARPDLVPPTMWARLAHGAQVLTLAIAFALAVLVGLKIRTRLRTGEQTDGPEPL
jgi:CHAT domain-containing protein/tetratricopeptide (TPR) repeat protein